MEVESLLLFTLHNPEILKELQILVFKIHNLQNSLAVRWLGPCAFTSGDPGSTPGRESKIPHATRSGHEKKEGHILKVLFLKQRWLILGKLIIS